MKNILVILCVFAISKTVAQISEPIVLPPMVIFEYDDSGNQILRSLCINCIPTRGRARVNLEETISDNIEFLQNDVLKYYPNPVKEELHLDWSTTDNKNLTVIYIYSMGGQLLKKYSNLENVRTATIPFIQYSKGIYTVNLVYADGSMKSIKIIKD